MVTKSTRLGPVRDSDEGRPRLFVVRESDEHNHLLFDAMREQTYQAYRFEPEIQAVLDSGLDALSRSGQFSVELPDSAGTKRRVTVLPEELVRGATRAVLFQVGGVWHLWSMSSAAKTDGDGVNDFTAILIDVVERLRPRSVHAANFSRLIRSSEQGSLLLHKFCGRVDKVHAGAVEFALAGPGADVGRMMFSMFSTIASMERDWIVTRLLTGKIAKWRRGEWPYGTNTVPYGYCYDATGARLRPDLRLREQVRKMLIVLAQDMSPSAMVDELAAIGVTSMRPSRGRGTRESVALMRNPRAFIDSLYAWAPVWLVGEYLYRIANASAHVDEIAGVEVVRFPEVNDDPGELQMLCSVELPAGGWAEQSVLDAVRVAAMRRSAERVAGGRVSQRPLSHTVQDSSVCPDLLDALLPALAMRGNDAVNRQRRQRRRGSAVLSLLSGMGWTDGDSSFELQVLRRGVYSLMRMPLETRTPDAPAGERGHEVVSR